MNDCKKILAVLVLVGGLADVILTLAGQIGRPGILEDDPIARAILGTGGNWFFFFAFLAFHLAAAGVVYLGRDRIAYPLAAVMWSSDVVAIVFWLAIFGFPIQILSIGVYFFLGLALVIYSVDETFKNKGGKNGRP